MVNLAFSVAVLLAAAALLSKSVRRCELWQAATTPLASIIGSGFLVLGPLLSFAYGYYAPLVMLGLCVVAFGYGDIIRFNMAKDGDDRLTNGKLVLWIDRVAAWALAFAYIVSVAYYLNLFGAFAISINSSAKPEYAEYIAITSFGVILVIGLTRGFDGLEFFEKLAVGLKLTIIAGLLVGLAMYFAEHAPQNHIVFEAPTVQGWEALFLAFGLLVTVQGFETSRYLTSTYSVPTAIQSMTLAQVVTSTIYLSYIVLLTFSLKPSERLLSETAIIDMMTVITPLLPGLLLVAALSAQLSAAIADTHRRRRRLVRGHIQRVDRP